MKEPRTLQDKLQKEEREAHHTGRFFAIIAFALLVLACLGIGASRMTTWAEAGAIEAAATSAVVETRQAKETATAVAKAPKPGYQDPADAVIYSLEQWYSVDYTGEFEDWAEKMCEFTTPYACEREVYNIGGENWKNNVVPKQIQSQADIVPLRKIWEKSHFDDKARRNVDAQVWEYQLTGNLFPGKEFVRYVMISDEGAGWLMVHNLWDEEAEQLLAEIELTPEPNT